MQRGPGICPGGAQKPGFLLNEIPQALVPPEFVVAQAILRWLVATRQGISQGLFASFQVAEGIHAIDS